MLKSFGKDEQYVLKTLIADGGDITIGMIASVECGATAADVHNALATLV